jgi:CDP-4-dehydro-6-deoxyglucose reductase, E3
MRRIPAVRRTLEVTATRALSPSVRHLELASTDGLPIDYLAGQWFKLYLPGGLDRDYSIASAPDPRHPDRIEIAVTRVDGGAGSEILHRAAVGDRFEALGPNGLFVREAEQLAMPAVYVGTGTGLAPLRAMLSEELASERQSPQVLLFGCRTEAEILYRDELEAWTRQHPRFRLLVTLSRSTESWSGRRGWVQHHLPEIAPPLLPAHFYVCGLSKMITDVRRVLKETLGVDRKRIHSERYD